MGEGVRLEVPAVVEGRGEDRDQEAGAGEASRELKGLVDLLPPRIREAVSAFGDRLMEVALDLGRPPEVRVDRGTPVLLDTVGEVTRADVSYIVAKLGARFRDDRRAGVDGTLHRISAIVGPRGDVIGVTMRVGRHVQGAAGRLVDLLRSCPALLLVGPPGSGKTTVLRDVCRFLSVEMGKRVVVVDTSGEIGGWGDVTHPAVGRARRLPVPDVTQQYRVMIEAVQNHTPDVVVIDEIGRPEEVDAARTVSRRGVKLVATCHGRTLVSVIQNPVLRSLLGIGRDGTVEGPPVFDSLVEVRSPGKFVVHRNLSGAVRWALERRERGRGKPGGEGRGGRGSQETDR